MKWYIELPRLVAVSLHSVGMHARCSHLEKGCAKHIYREVDMPHQAELLTYFRHGERKKYGVADGRTLIKCRNEVQKHSLNME